MSLSESLFSLDEEIISISDSSVDSGSYASGASSDTTSTNVSRISLKEEEDTDDESLATKESKDIIKFRFFLITVLFWSTAGVGLAVWIYFGDDIKNEFEELYAEEAGELFDQLAGKFLVAFGAIDSFALALSTQFVEWPFVTVPKFYSQAEKLRKLTSAVVITNYHFVEENQREEWESYSASHDSWVADGIRYQQKFDLAHQTSISRGTPANIESINSNVFSLGNNSSLFLPRWQQHPISSASPYGWNGFNNKALADAWEIFDHNESRVVLSCIANIRTIKDPDLDIEETNDFISTFIGDNTYHREPFSDIFYPIAEDVDEVLEANSSTDDIFTKDVVGVVAATFYWRDMLKSFLKDKIDGMHIVIENSCNQTFTYTMSGSEPNYLGSGDFHESIYEDSKMTFRFSDIGIDSGLELSSSGCQYTIHTYPSSKMFADFEETQPIPSAIAGVAVIIFIFTSILFFGYDFLVERRQRKVYSSAMKNNAIVSSLFPKNVRDRLYQETTHPKPFQPAKSRMKSFISDGNNLDHTNNSSANDANTAEDQADAPIADLFSNCTVLFADISGFTSWSSERSPGQVFILLENIYGAFDRIADRRGVFKVETIGDCYMAVTGLPNPRSDHAVIMARFARDCRDELNALTRSLEVSLGPETSDLTMRFGLHSGPVTAGVLRGQKSRFQLFGDTVNTASRMESTGIRNRIHASDDTARLLVEAGKSSWLTPRNHTIMAKGKGELVSFWLFDKHFNKRGSMGSSTVTSDSNGSIGSTIHSSSMHVKSLINDKRGRLIDWNVDLFAGLIRKIVARRRAQNHARKSTLKSKEKAFKIGDEISIGSSSSTHGMVLDEVVEIIELPAFDPEVVALQEDQLRINLGIPVMVELRDYISTISQKYKKNSFHNFEHASHVTMSVAKLLSRIVAPDLEVAHAVCNSTLHDHTYGITSDPLTQFACILSALIHDVDHQGVPNTRLVEEEDNVAIKYDGRSVAEQNSVDISWALFLEPQFSELRDAVCPTDKELNRLRQLVVNMVLATDIMDKDLKQLRNQRWEKAFSSHIMDKNETNQNKINRKATIVLEHSIQASDVCHTMQHWHVYRKWNERLFEEMYFAYKIGRANIDPSTFWYEGELGFFDHYIIPLSKKLSDCGVFGVSSDEYLNYALRNRKEWEQRGHAVVAEMIERLQEKTGDTIANWSCRAQGGLEIA